MSNALEAASLIMVPSGYENGTLASVKPNDGTGDFTFSRGSNLSATRINEQGYIEKGYENLLLQSNTFDTTWTKANGATITGGQSGYDGSNNAWLLNAPTAGSARVVFQNVSVSGIHTASIRVKKGTTDFVAFRAFNIIELWADLSSTGVITQVNGEIDSKIISLGNGWFELNLTGDFSSVSSLAIYAVNASGSYDADAGDNIYIQDAMLNQGLVAYPYIETTTAPVAGGILEDMPRLDWSGSCPSLLLEPSRTNLVTNSEYIVQPVNGTNTYNQGISPEGVNNAVKYTADTTFPNIRFAGFSVTSGNQYTLSCFVKYVGYQWMYINFNTGFTNDTTDDCWFDIQNGLVGTIGSSITNESIEDYGNGWYRISATSAATSTGTGQIRLHHAGGDGLNTIPSTDTGLHNLIYGAQLEQDATYPTSYIPTYGVSQTRAADDMDLNLSTTWDSTGSWTFFFELERMNDDSVDVYNIIRFDGTQGDLLLRDRSTTLQVLVFGIEGISAATTGTISKGDTYKIATKWDGATIKAFFNGSEIVFSNPSSGTSGFNFIEYNTTHIKHKEVYFPTALSDEECIQLTTV